MKKVINELIDHQSLDKASARQVLIDMASGQYNPSQVASFITVYMMRSITVAELEGFRDAMLELCIPVHFEEPVMDVCGTGGDGKNTFNISTLSSFIVAAAGQPVAKHGNYGVSSVSGSSNILEHFGFKFSNDINLLKRSVAEANICFMHAPLFHPALKNVAPIRKELGVKTFFNMLGPMINPAFPSKQLVGVFNLELARQYAYIYQQTQKDFLIVHALDGYDEVSLTGGFKFYSNEGEHQFEPEDLGLSRLMQSDIGGGASVEASAQIFTKILSGEGTQAQNEVVLVNAGLALYAANRSKSLEQCIGEAKEALMSGRAMKTFKKLISLQP
ncbi:anthranilate phosphoribosyltransferase [Chryseotalea sanaruensis]|uniref:Anthranilate phosphoribosyltransferase n=1 Tax=Chryseotalea sanaruensis TaxID=2482724 RepID=A0A401U4Z2_9BACT|nr:anthranilate phosphoribosyltransferase [Chryseotalea sanaruensis]GCC49952.1 anthranilate phosphoribosyltransferase [Chryseotalea sanaruensis]